MKKNTVTPEQVKRIMDACEFDVKTVYDKVTVVTAILPNGFTIVESSACVDPDNYDESIGAEICKKRIEDEIWKLEGYMLQEKLYRIGAVGVKPDGKWQTGKASEPKKHEHTGFAVMGDHGPIIHHEGYREG